MHPDTTYILRDKEIGELEQLLEAKRMFEWLVESPTDRVPRLLKRHYLKEILDWILSKGLSLHKDGTGVDTLKGSWELLHAVLRHCGNGQWAGFASGLNQCIVKNVSGFSSMVIEGSGSVNRSESIAVLKSISQVLELLAEQKIKHQYTIHLEHASKIMESSLHLLHKNFQSASDEEQACICFLVRESCKIFESHLDRFTNQKKLWEAVMHEQFGMLLVTAFHDQERSLLDSETRVRSRHILEGVLYHPECVAGIIEVLSSGLEEPRRGRHYASKLFTELETCMDTICDEESQRSFTSGIEWLIGEYKKRFDEILLQKGNHRSNYGKYVESHVRSADISLVLAISDMLVRREGMNRNKKCFVVACFRALTNVVKEYNIYRPLENDVGNKRERIERIAGIIIQDPDITNDLGLLQDAVLTLLNLSSIEQHGYDIYLDDVWKMIDVLGLHGVGKAHCSRPIDDLAIKLVAEYASFRRLDTLLYSLQKSLCSFSMVGTLKILCNARVLEAWKENCKSAPTGQSVLILALLGKFFILYSDLKSINSPEEVVYDFLGAFLPVVISHVPVILENATSVSTSLELLIKAIGEIVINNIEEESEPRITSILRIYESCLSVHTVCCGMIPRLKPLVCQETRPPFSEPAIESSDIDRYFLPMIDQNNLVKKLSLHSMCEHLSDTIASGQLSGECSPSLVPFASALGACMIRRLEVLYEQIIYKENSRCEEDGLSSTGDEFDRKKEYSLLVKDLSRIIWMVGLLPSSMHQNAGKERQDISKAKGASEKIFLSIMKSKLPLYHLLSCLDKKDQQRMVDMVITLNLGHQVISNQQSMGDQAPKDYITRANKKIKKIFKDSIVHAVNFSEGTNRKRKRDTKDRSLINIIKMLKSEIEKIGDSKSAWTEILAGITQVWKEHDAIWSESHPTKAQCDYMSDMVIEHSKVIVFFTSMSWKGSEMNHMLLWSITLNLLYALLESFCCRNSSNSALYAAYQYRFTEILQEGLALEKNLSQMDTVPLNLFNCLKDSQRLRARLIDMLLFKISSKRESLSDNESYWDWMVSLCAWRKYLASKTGASEPDLLSSTGQMPASLKNALDLSSWEGKLKRVLQDFENGSISHEDATAHFLTALKTYEVAVTCMNGQVEEQQVESIFLTASVASFAGQTMDWYIDSSFHSDELEKHLFPSLISVFQACIKQSSHHLITLGATNHGAVACLLDIVGFMHSFTRISFQTRPRISWNHYCSLVTAYLYLISLCGSDFGQGHMVRPNAPKQAMFAQASGSGARSIILRKILIGLEVIISQSSRDELTQLLQKLFDICSSVRGPYWTIYSSSIINLFLVILEQDENPVLKDYIQRQGGEILSNLTCLAQSEAFQDFSAENAPGQLSCQELMAVIKSIFHEENEESQRLVLSDSFPASGAVESLITNLANLCRAMESIFCRPTRFPATVIPVRYICMVLNSIPFMVGSLSRGISNPQELNPAFMNICHVLTGIMRHRASNLTRSMHLLTACVGSLQHLVTAAACHLITAPTFFHAWLEAQSRLLESFASLKSSSRYCSDLLFNYIILMASPLSQTSIHRLESTFDVFSSRPITWKQFLGRRPFFNAAVNRTTLPSTATKGQHMLLEPGACALYGACSPSDLEYLFTKLGGTESTSLWRSALSEIKGVYESQYKYIGKV